MFNSFSLKKDIIYWFIAVKKAANTCKCMNTCILFIYKKKWIVKLHIFKYSNLNSCIWVFCIFYLILISDQYLSRTALHIDAVYDTRRHWVWESTMSRISHDITRNATNPNHYHCGTVYSWLGRHPHLIGIECSTLHNALCLLNWFFISHTLDILVLRMPI